MKTKLAILLLPLLVGALLLPLHAQDFKLSFSGYFNRDGVDVMAFDDFYPECHQGGISVLMHGHRIASNGDIRFDATPDQWQPVPKQLDRKIEGDRIVTTLCFPDSSRHFTGFNPMIYPDLPGCLQGNAPAAGQRFHRDGRSGNARPRHRTHPS